MSNTNSTRFRWTAVALSLAASLIHFYLAIKSYQLKLGTGEKSACNINATFNCDAVSLSPYSEFLGMPIAVWGGVFNLILAVLLIMSILELSGPRARLDRITLLLAGWSVGATVVMGTISVTALQTYCLFCIATYVISLVVFGLHLKFSEAQGLFTSELLETLKSSTAILVLLALIPAASFLFHRIALNEFGFEQNKWRVTEAINVWKTAPTYEFPPEFGLKVKPPGDYKIVLVEFADFLCPHCKTASGPLHGFTEANSDVQLVFIPFPLDGSCNPGITQKGDGLRCNLASAPFCAEKLSGKGWAAHDYIFEHQSDWNSASYPGLLKTLLEKLQIKSDEFQACLDSNEIKDLISKGADLAVKAKILGTPSIFANGKKLDSGQYYPVLEALGKELNSSK